MVTPSTASSASRPIQWIRHYDPGAGFFALVTYALNGLRHAARHCRTPVVWFDGASTPAFHDPARGDNVWEYFFAPLGGLSSAEALAAERAGTPAVTLTSDELGHLHHHDPDRVATFWSYDRPADPVAWMEEKRALGRRLVGEHLRVRPEIAAAVDAFHAAHLADRPALGVHIRGTDFHYATPLSPERYFRAIEARLAQPRWRDARLFLATDQAQFVDRFAARFPDRIVRRDCLRSTSATAPFQLAGGGGYAKGADVLIDALLLARCGHVIKGPAAVGEYALWFNPRATCDDFAPECDFDPRSRAHTVAAFDALNVGGAPGWWHAPRQLLRDARRGLARLRWRLGRGLRRRSGPASGETHSR